MSPIQSLPEAIYTKLLEIYGDTPFNFKSEKIISRFEFIYLRQFFQLLGKNLELSLDERNFWLNEIRDYQETDGYFTTGSHSTPLIKLSTTALSIVTLQQMDADLKYPIYNINQFEERKYTENWFNNIKSFVNQSDFLEIDAIQSGKLFLNMATLLEKAYQDGLLLDEVLPFFYNCCDSQADPVSGLWLPGSTEQSHFLGLVDALFRTRAYLFWGRLFPTLIQ